MVDDDLPPEAKEFIEKLWEKNPGGDAATIRKLYKDHIRSRAMFLDDKVEAFMMWLIDKRLEECVKDQPPRRREHWVDRSFR